MQVQHEKSFFALHIIAIPFIHCALTLFSYHRHTIWKPNPFGKMIKIKILLRPEEAMFGNWQKQVFD